MPDLHPAEEALAKLGALGSAEAIRMFLGDTGIKGQCGNASACAVAAYINSPQVGLSPDERVVVTGSHIRVLDIYGRNGVAGRYANPAPVRDFISRFDGRYYPELEVGR